MKAYIFFDVSFYLIEFEPFLGTDIKDYQKSLMSGTMKKITRL